MNVGRYIITWVVLLVAVLPCSASENQIEQGTIDDVQNAENIIEDISESLDVILSKTKTRTQLQNRPVCRVVRFPQVKLESFSCLPKTQVLHSYKIDKCNLYCAYLE